MNYLYYYHQEPDFNELTIQTTILAAFATANRYDCVSQLIQAGFFPSSEILTMLKTLAGEDYIFKILEASTKQTEPLGNWLKENYDEQRFLKIVKQYNLIDVARNEFTAQQIAELEMWDALKFYPLEGGIEILFNHFGIEYLKKHLEEILDHLDRFKYVRDDRSGVVEMVSQICQLCLREKQYEFLYEIEERLERDEYKNYDFKDISDRGKYHFLTKDLEGLKWLFENEKYSYLEREFTRTGVITRHISREVGSYWTAKMIEILYSEKSVFKDVYSIVSQINKYFDEYRTTKTFADYRKLIPDNLFNEVEANKFQYNFSIREILEKQLKI